MCSNVTDRLTREKKPRPVAICNSRSRQPIDSNWLSPARARKNTIHRTELVTSSCMMCWLAGFHLSIPGGLANGHTSIKASASNPPISKKVQRGNEERIGLSTDIESSTRTQNMKAESIIETVRKTRSYTWGADKNLESDRFTP